MKHLNLLPLLVTTIVATTADAQITSTSQSVRSQSSGLSGTIAIDGFPQIVEWDHFHPADEFVDTGFSIGGLTVGTTAALNSRTVASQGRIRLSAEVTGELASDTAGSGITSASSNAYYEFELENPGRMSIDAFVETLETLSGQLGDAPQLSSSSQIVLIHPDGHVDVWNALAPTLSDDGTWIDPGLINVPDPRFVTTTIALESGVYELIFAAEVLGSVPSDEEVPTQTARAAFHANVMIAEGPAVEAAQAWVRSDEGGVQSIRIDATPAAAGRRYLLIGSATAGATPLAGDLALPFALDAYSQAGPMAFGTFDADGLAEVSVTVPADPRLVGVVLRHVPVVLDATGAPLAIGNAATLEIR